MSSPPAEGSAAALSLLVFSGEYERLHYALVLAASAAAIGRPASLFFAGPAVGALRAASAEGEPAWRRLPATAGASAGAVDDGHARAGIATFEVLLAACVALGVRFAVCEMALRAAGLTIADLRADLPLRIAGAASLLAEGGSLVSL